MTVVGDSSFVPVPRYSQHCCVRLRTNQAIRCRSAKPVVRLRCESVFNLGQTPSTVTTEPSLMSLSDVAGREMWEISFRIDDHRSTVQSVKLSQSAILELKKSGCDHSEARILIQM